jgi:uncharacterized membrane protein YqjE
MSTGQGRPDVDLAVQPKQPDRSLGELFTEMTSDMSTLIRKEIELAKVETKEEMGKVGKASGMLVGGIVAAHMALLILSFALAWLLDEVMPTPLAFFIVGVIYVIVAAVLVSSGRKKLRDVNLKPEQTVQTLKEDVEWAKAQRS